MKIFRTYFVRFKKRRKLKNKTKNKAKKQPKKHYRENKEAARRIITERVAYLNQGYGFTIGKIAIRNQKTRWGSCSKRGNLNFNYRIATLSQELADYVIVHELCHLGEFNHSARFWDLVAKVVPNHRELRRQLRKSFVK